MSENDTIVAVATPPGLGGIGVVRCSGPESLKIALQFFSAHKKRYSPENFPDRRAVFGKLVEPGTKKLLDHCILTTFQSGASYTGELVVEISCHGSRPILRRVEELFLEKGARPSGPGEFTLRAVLAGRLDLAQAEAVNRLIRADTLVQAEQAVQQLDGNLSKLVHELEELLFDTIAALEVEVDFAEENDSSVNRERVKENINTLALNISGITESFAIADTLREGAVVVIAGKANAGKSTLFNTLLREERAIVDSEPGTTRDFISETIDLDGLPVTLFDTAGLRIGGESVEQEGMRRSEKLLLNADLVIHVYAAGEEEAEVDKRIAERLTESETRRLKVINKIDQWPNGPVPDCDVRISALTGDGIDQLRQKLLDELHVDELASSRSFVTEKRQQQLFLHVENHIESARELLDSGAYDEVILEELNSAMYNLREITGRGGSEEILSRIFSSFCIGK